MLVEWVVQDEGPKGRRDREVEMWMLDMYPKVVVVIRQLEIRKSGKERRQVVWIE